MSCENDELCKRIDEEGDFECIRNNENRMIRHV